MAQRINVRAVAEFYCEGGDLSRESDLYARMQEGSRAHRALQSLYPDDYRAEVPVSRTVECLGIEFALYGRVDGLWRRGDEPVIEEIKSTLREVTSLTGGEYPAHWAQAQLYAAILCHQEQANGAWVNLVYCQAGTMQTTRLERHYTAGELEDLMQTCLEPLARWTGALNAHREDRLPTLRALTFPYDRFRAGQREMAANVYVALRDRKRLLCQAPTGIGKTVASLFPSLKALGEGKAEAVFYLTARTTGARAVLDALERMRRQGAHVRTVFLRAKDKVCPFPEGDCDPAVCPRARGYYDRRRAALYESLFTDRLGPDEIARLAAAHELCPFELSLDLSETADLIVCDYNYVFDPRVRLKRWFSGKSGASLLIDEAHNLPARVRDMLSASLSERDVELLRRSVGREKGRKHLLYRALTALLAPLRVLRAEHPLEEASSDLPAALKDASQAFQEACAPFLAEPAGYAGALWEQYFAALDFLAAAERFDGHYRALYLPEDRHLTVRLWCADPADHIRETLSRVRGAALFSATLTPLPFYRDLMGLSEADGDALLDLPSPFPPENLEVRRVSLPMRYRQRDSSVQPLARLMLQAVREQPGNYLACFPSYAFMRQVFDALEADAGEVRLHMQSPQMTEFAREDFLAQFTPHPERPLLALIVMGGVFSEGIDLPGDLLRGAFIVGTGVPQVCLENDALRALFEDKFGPGAGYRYAYLYPGLARAFQAAGRVIRTETDTGRVFLIDSRWLDPEHAALLPRHWGGEKQGNGERWGGRLFKKGASPDPTRKIL